MNNLMDEIDREIIRQLQKDSRTPFLQIAKKLKISEGTVRKRVARLTANKIIKKFTIDTSNNVSAIVGIQTVSNVETKSIAAKLKESGIDRICEVTGRFDIICILKADDMERINDLLEKIRCTAGVVHTETFSVLKEN